MARFVGLDVSQRLTWICVVDDIGKRLWRGQCATDPEHIAKVVRRQEGDDVRIGIETGPMTPWLVHELRAQGLDITCLDARHASAALKMQMNKTDQNDAEGLAQITDISHASTTDNQTTSLPASTPALTGCSFLSPRLGPYSSPVSAVCCFAGDVLSSIGAPDH